MSNRRVSPLTEYYQLDPTVYADQQYLVSLRERIIGTRKSKANGGAVVAAAIAHEIAQAPGNDPELKQEYGIVTARSYATKSPAGGYVVKGAASSLLRAHLPYLRAGVQPKSRKHVALNTTRLMERWYTIHGFMPEKPQSMNVGRSRELAAAMLVHSIGEGLAAYTSLPRQDSNEQLVENRRYRWDVSVDSDGSVLPAGAYRAQVKAAGVRNSQIAYHPDIAILPMRRIFHSKEAIFDISRLVNPQDDEATLSLAAAQDMLLELLDATGPASDQTTYL